MQFRSDFGAELTDPSLPRPVNQHETGGGATARIGLTFCRWSIRTGGGALTSGRAIHFTDYGLLPLDDGDPLSPDRGGAGFVTPLIAAGVVFPSDSADLHHFFRTESPVPK
jgi:hypothetical protein